MLSPFLKTKFVSANWVLSPFLKTTQTGPNWIIWIPLQVIFCYKLFFLFCFCCCCCFLSIFSLISSFVSFTTSILLFYHWIFLLILWNITFFSNLSSFWKMNSGLFADSFFIDPWNFNTRNMKDQKYIKDNTGNVITLAIIRERFGKFGGLHLLGKECKIW